MALETGELLVVIAASFGAVIAWRLVEWAMIIGLERYATATCWYGPKEQRRVLARFLAWFLVIALGYLVMVLATNRSAAALL